MNNVLRQAPDGKKKIVTHVYINKQTGDRTEISVVVSDELMSVETTIPADISRDPEKAYDWYDINETVVHVIDKGKEVSTTTTITKGDYRTTTAYNIAWVADWLVDDEIENEGYGGVTWMSSNGKGGETKRGAADVRVETIDGLLGAISGLGTSLGMGSGGLVIPQSIIKNRPLIEALDVLAKTVDKGANVMGNIITTVDVAKENSGGTGSSDNPKGDTTCTFCNKSGDHGLGYKVGDTKYDIKGKEIKQ